MDLQTARLQVTGYWTYGQIPSRPEVKFDEAVEETGRLLRSAVQRLSTDQYHPGVFLSGGRDGRTILGLIPRRPVAALTFGTKDCRDVVYAHKIARKVAADHYWVDFPDGNWVLENIQFHLELTKVTIAGSISMEFGFPLAREVMDVNLTGWDGGSIMGFENMMDRLEIYPPSDDAFLAHLFDLFTQKYIWPG